eukprot:359537-Chlamydomonas_euryale.AAC.3
MPVEGPSGQHSITAPETRTACTSCDTGWNALVTLSRVGVQCYAKQQVGVDPRPTAGNTKLGSVHCGKQHAPVCHYRHHWGLTGDAGRPSPAQKPKQPAHSPGMGAGACLADCWIWQGRAVRGSFKC